MGLLNPPVEASEKFTDHYSEGEKFFLTGIRTVKVNTDYGKGDMVLLTVRGIEPELGIWGDYLTKQAHACEHGDLNAWYVVTREVVEGYSKRPVKMLKPAEAPAEDSPAGP